MRIDATAGQLRIHQQSQRAVIDWDSFSIERGEVTRFLQPNASAAALNRVRGTSSSRIEGMLRANGNVYLINPNGILIGPSGTIDVGGFVASTLDTSDDEFMRGGDLRFAGNSDAAIINLGSISALDGDVVLMAGSVLNAGTIRAPRGTAALAAGNDILLAESGEERVFVRGSGGSRKAEGVTNTGDIEANIAELKAHGGNIYGMAVKNEGRVAATGVTRSGGQIFLSAGGGKVRSTGSLRAKKSDGSGGRVKIDSGSTGKTEIGGTVDASGETGAGGEIAILGNEIEVFNGALILNDGATMGGTTRIGGGLQGREPAFSNAETVTIGNGALVSARALGTGDGGQVIVFSKGILTFDGHLSVAGANGGRGGFAELSGQREVFIRNLAEQVDLGMAQGSAGTLLLDPIDISVTDGANNGIVAGTSITDGSISHFLTNTGNLSIVTTAGAGNGDITLASTANISWATANNLTFSADRDFIMTGGAVIQATGGGAFSATAQRSVRLGTAASIATTSAALTLSANPTAATTGQFEGIFLGNDASISSTTGAISLTGRGGNDTGAGNHGIQMESTASIGSLGGNITLDGRAGTTTGAAPTQEGVLIKGNITTTGNGTISITGTGGNGTSGNLGVHLFDNVLISTVNGNLSITGTSGSGSNSPGIQVADFGSGPTVITSTSGNISLSGNGSAGASEGILAFGSGVSIGGGTGNVDFTATGALSLTSNASIAAIGSGAVSLTSNRSISLGAGTSVTTVNGNLTVSANQQLIPNNDDFIGILVDGGTIQSTGTGQVSVRGKGGNKILPFTNSDYQIGVAVRNGGQILGGTTGTLFVEGIGRQIASGRSNYNYGVQVRGSGSLISSNGASVSVTGLGGNGFNDNSGIFLQNDGRITSGGSGNVTVSGTGGNGDAYNNGITISSGGVITSGGAGTVTVTATGGTNAWDGSDTDGLSIGSSSSITSGGGDVFVTGYGGIGGETSYGIGLYSSGMITSGGGNVTVTGEARNVTFSNGYQGGVGLWNSDAKITSGGGNVTVIGTGATGGRESYGVILTSSASITSGGAGTVSVTGTAGTASDYSEGVAVYSGADITSNLGAVSVTGYAGTATGSFGYSDGIRVHGSGSTITSGGGNVSVTGTGGSGGANENYGVIVNFSGLITAGGTGSVTLNGFGSETNGVNPNEISAGVALFSSGDVTSNGGAVSVTGFGGDANGVSGYSYGIRLSNAGTSITSGGGNVAITGTGGEVALESIGVFVSDSSQVSAGGTGSVMVQGTGGGGMQYNEGVTLHSGGTITSGGGAVTVIGQGGTGTPLTDNFGSAGIGLYFAGSRITSGGGNIVVQGTGGIGPSDNNGIWIGDGGQIVGSTGTLSVTGTGGSDSNPTAANHGILIEGLNSRIIGSVGNMSITGIGGADGAINHGIRLQDRAEIVYSGGGLLTLEGSAGVGSGFGISLSNATNGGASIRSTGSGNILLITDSLEIASNTESIQAGTNRVSIRQRSNGHLIDLGGSDTATSLGLSDAELDRITANLIEIGNGNSGTFTVSNPITSATHLNLRSGDGFDILDAITMAVDKHLDIATSDPVDGLISLSGSNAILRATGTGNISLTSRRNIRVTSGSGLSTVDGNLTLTANQELSPTSGNFSGIDLDDADLSTTGTGTLTLTGRGGDDEGGQHGILLRGGSSLTTNARNLTLSGAAPDPLSSGLRIELASLGAGGGTIQLTGNGGTTSIHSTSSSATIGGATDILLVRSISGNVEITGQVRGADLQLQDLSSTESVDFLLTNTANDVDRINAFSNGSNGRVGSIDFRDTDGFQVTEFLGASGVSASGNVSLGSSLFSGSPVVVDRAVRSAGGNLLIRGLDVVIDGTDVTTTGSGTLTLESGRAILVWDDSLLSVNNGAMKLEANQGEGSLAGNFTGITVLGSRLQSLGTGGIQLSGAGGDGSIGSDFAFPGFTNPSSIGIRLDGGTVISSSDSSTNEFGIELYGSGGLGASDSIGISIANVDTILSSAGRSILVEGYGGGAPTGQRNRGVLFTGGLIQAANSGHVTVYGDGGDGVSENDGIQFDNGARVQVNGGDLTLDGYAGETLGIGVMLGNNSGNLLVNGTGTATVKGSGNNAPGIFLGNSSAVIGGASADYVDIFSRQGNLTLQREALAGGNVFISADFGDTLVGGEVTSGTGDVEIEGDNVTIDAPVTAIYGDVTVTFGDNFEPGEAEPEEPLEITFIFDGTGTINQLPTAGGRVRYVGGNGTGDLLTFAGYIASEIDLDSADLSLIENVIGTGSSDDRLRGPAAGSNYEFTGPNAFHVSGVAYSAFENVLGGIGNDVFAFTGNASMGGSLDGGGGTNSLDYSSYATGVIIDLENGAATGIIGGFENIASFIGSGNIDTITGPGSASTYQFTGPDAMQVGSVSVSGFENLIAGPLEDTFVFLPGASLRGYIDGGASPTTVVNHLDYSLYGAPVAVNLGGSPLPGATGIAGGFSNLNRFTGSALLTDQFFGSNLATSYQITAPNAFSSSLFTATAFENLTGGVASDTFLPGPGAALNGRLSGGAGAGTDTLDYSFFGRAVTVNVGPNTTTGFGGGFVDLERIIGSPGNDRFNFLNQATIQFVDGGGGTDLIEINDSTLRGENTYDITANSVSRNPLYTFNNFEALRLFLGTGNNTVNSGFFPYTQFIHGGSGYNTLNLPGVSSLNQGNPIRNVYHYGIDAPRPDGNDTGGLLQLEISQQNQGPNTEQGFNTENRFSIVDPGTLSQQIGALSGAFAAAITAQASLIVVDGNPYLVFRPFSLDGSGITPSNLAINALNESLGVNANLELAAAIGYTGPLFLFNPDGPLGLDLSGAPIDPAILTVLQESLAIAAASELSAAIGLSLVVSIVPTDGISPIALDGSAPGQSIVLLLSEQLGDPAQNELQAAIGTN